jgi:hypothetical protein
MALFRRLSHGRSVIIGNLNICRPVTLPDKTHSVLIVDPDAVLAPSITGQSFQPFPRREPQIVQIHGSVNLIQFAKGDSFYAFPAAALPALEQIGGVIVAEVLDQSTLLYDASRGTVSVKHLIQAIVTGNFAASQAASPPANSISPITPSRLSIPTAIDDR